MQKFRNNSGISFAVLYRRRGLRRREGATGNLSLANTNMDSHRFAMLEGRQIRTSVSVDDNRYSAFAPSGAAFTATGDGTTVTDAGAATSRIPAASVRLSESLAASHETRAADARSTSRQFSLEAGIARSAAATDATRLSERFARDVSTGNTHGFGVTESESDQVQALNTHYDRMAETSGLSRDRMAALAADARIGGGFDKIVRLGADGSARWRGQTISSAAWNRLQEYAESEQVLDLWSSVLETSRRYAAQTGESEHAGLEESFSTNLTDLRRFEERASLALQESQNWSEQAARVRSEAQNIDRELGQPFFVWLSEQNDPAGRTISAAGAIKLASPQTPEAAETLRQYAAAFVEEKFDRPPGPDPADTPGRTEYTAARKDIVDWYHGDIGDRQAGAAQEIRDRAQAVGTPGPAEVEAAARDAQADTEAVMGARQTRREGREAAVEGKCGRDGRWLNRNRKNLSWRALRNRFLAKESRTGFLGRRRTRRRWR